MHIPEEIVSQLKLGAAAAISLSGGKDSQALLKTVTDYMRANFPNNPVFAIHADLGRMEWPQTPAFVEKLCAEIGIELIIVRREAGDLLARFYERMHKLKGTGKPFWSSAKNRYCTSDLKRGPINKHLRKYNRVISFEGIRADESTARSNRPNYELRHSICTKTRIAYTCYPLLSYSINDVFQTYGNTTLDLTDARNHFKATGQIPDYWKFHPVYAMGNDRLSCAICVLGSMNDVANGVKHNPELADELIAMEDESGFTFKHNQSLKKFIQYEK